MKTLKTFDYVLLFDNEEYITSGSNLEQIIKCAKQLSKNLKLQKFNRGKYYQITYRGIVIAEY